MVERQSMRRLRLAVAVASMVYGLAMVIFFGYRFFFGGQLPRPVQFILLLVGVMALVFGLAVGALALRKSGHI